MWPVLLITALLAGTQAEPGRRLALVVGIDRTDDPGWPALKFAEKDATDMAAALAPTFSKVLVLTGAGDRPTAERVHAAFDELETLSTSTFDTVVVYFSLHGTLARDDRGVLHRVLILADTRADRPLETGLSAETFLARLDRLRSRRKLAVIASCHSGTGKSQLSPAIRSALERLKGGFFSEPNIPRGEGRILLAASAWGEPAREDDGLENDVYTHYFLQALKGFDLNQDGATTALEAHEYARQRTIERTRGEQRPSLEAELVGEDPIVLAGERNRTGSPVIASFASAFSGAVLEIDGRTKGALPGSFVLEPGDHHVRVYRPGDVEPLIDRELQLAPDGLLILERLPPRAAHRAIELGGGLAFKAARAKREYLPSRLSANASATIRPWPKWGFGLELGFSSPTQLVALPDPIAGSVKVSAELTIVDLAATAERTVLSLGPVDFDLQARSGASVISRRFTIRTIREPSQTAIAPLFGAGLSARWPITEVFGVTARADFQLWWVPIDDGYSPVPVDSYTLGLWVRP